MQKRQALRRLLDADPQHARPAHSREGAQALHIEGERRYVARDHAQRLLDLGPQLRHNIPQEEEREVDALWIDPADAPMRAAPTQNALNLAQLPRDLCREGQRDKGSNGLDLGPLRGLLSLLILLTDEFGDGRCVELIFG